MATTVISSPANEHRLRLQLMEAPVSVLVIGCGGTGSAIASGLPYLHQAMLAFGSKGLDVFFADADRISETNCVRQPFSLSEVGLYKASVLTNRINLFWGLNWKAINLYVDHDWSKEFTLVIGCVDSRTARAKMCLSRTVREAEYWLDIGNNADIGQFVLGQPQENRYNKKLECRLPTVAELFPEIKDSRLDKKDRLPSCSAIEALERQEPFINQTLAFQALAMLARLFRYGHLNHHGGFVNLTTGKTTSLPVNPEVWQRVKRRVQ